MQAWAPGRRLGFPGLATLALGPLSHPVLGVVGTAPGHEGEEGARRQGACCFEQARRRGIGFQPSCIFGWMSRQAQPPLGHRLPPRPTCTAGRGESVGLQACG